MDGRKRVIIMPKIKAQARNGSEYTMVRKVAWDKLWHVGYQKDNGEWSYDRVDKETALQIADINCA